jgi:hypothetical protein
MPRVGGYEGNMTFIWRDLDEADAAGASSDEILFEFVTDAKKTSKKDFAKFYEVVLRALYERKFGESSEKATATELEKMFAVYVCYRGESLHQLTLDKESGCTNEYCSYGGTCLACVDCGSW